MKRLLTLTILLLASIGYAQLKTVSGRVIDGENKEPLFGSSVEVIGSQIRVITDFDGNFHLPRISTDTASIEIHFLGYKTEVINISTLKNTSNFTVKLYPDVEVLDNIEVVGRFRGQQKALQMQKKADNIKNVVSSEQIKLFPDLNAADAVKRLPGITLQREQGEGKYVQVRGTPPELTTFNVNGAQIPSPEGDVRFVGMDIISSDQIEFIEVNKTLTPDMDGDAIGGNVNIITKVADDTIPEITTSLAGGYNQLAQAPNYQGQFSFSQRYKKLGFNVNGNYYNSKQAAHNMEFKFRKKPIRSDTTTPRNIYVVHEDIELRQYDIERTRKGLNASFDYRFNSHSKLMLSAMYSEFIDDEVRYRTIYDGEDFITPTITTASKVARDLKDRTKYQKISTINFGGEHNVLGGSLDYGLIYSRATEDEPDRFEMSFESDNVSRMEVDLTDPVWPTVDIPGEVDSARAYSYDQHEFDELLNSTNYVIDENLTAQINYKIPYKVFETNGSFKFGGKLRQKEKSRDNYGILYNKYFPVFLPGTRQIYTQEGPELYLDTLTGVTTQTNLLGQGYDMGPMIDPGLAREFFEYYNQNFKQDESETKNEIYSEDYSATEVIYATYAMFTHNIGNLLVIGGVRYEQTDVQYTGKQLESDKGSFRGLTTLSESRSYYFTLPQVQLKYTLDKKSNLRFGYTYSYTRPNFEDIIPYKQDDSGSRGSVKLGNVDLKFPLALNLDLLYERYMAKGGLIAGGLFYKKIDNFVFQYRRRELLTYDPDIQPSNTEISMAYNGIEAFVYGAEITLNYKFETLPYFFKNLGIYTNYTYTASQAFIGQRDEVGQVKIGEFYIFDPLNPTDFIQEIEGNEEIPLPGQSAHTFNIAPFYDTGKLFIRLSLNYQSPFLEELGADKDLDLYYDESFYVDLSADYKITPEIKIFTQLVNITDQPLRRFSGEQSRTQQQEFYSRTGRIGVRMKF